MTKEQHAENIILAKLGQRIYTKSPVRYYKTWFSAGDLRPWRYASISIDFTQYGEFLFPFTEHDGQCSLFSDEENVDEQTWEDALNEYNERRTRRNIIDC